MRYLRRRNCMPKSTSRNGRAHLPPFLRRGRHVDPRFQPSQATCDPAGAPKDCAAERFFDAAPRAPSGAAARGAERPASPPKRDPVAAAGGRHGHHAAFDGARRRAKSATGLLVARDPRRDGLWSGHRWGDHRGRSPGAAAETRGLRRIAAGRRRRSSVAGSSPGRGPDRDSRRGISRVASGHCSLGASRRAAPWPLEPVGVGRTCRVSRRPSEAGDGGLRGAPRGARSSHLVGLACRSASRGPRPLWSRSSRRAPRPRSIR